MTFCLTFERTCTCTHMHILTATLIAHCAVATLPNVPEL